jgi:ubiquinone/menaquinone biosynthesis C-methylase UbiE
MKYFDDYDTKDRFASYWQQINSVLSKKPQSLLIIGAGNGLVPWYLKKFISRVVTLDISADLNPDIVADVRKIPLPDQDFDAVLCAEVLEHIPFADFTKALGEIKRVVKKDAIISLPHWGWTFKLNFKIPLLGECKKIFKLSGVKAHELGGEHEWEIGKKGHNVKKIKKVMQGYFIVEKDFIFFESPYHHFFYLKKR